MQKAKILIAQQHDLSGMRVLRIYLEKDYEQGEKDKKMLADNSDKDIFLVETEIYNSYKS